MNIKTIEEALKDYKRKKSVIKTTKERIKVFKKALYSPESGMDGWDVFLYASPSERMLAGGNKEGKKESPVEHTVVNSIVRGEKRVKRLRQWIQDEKSKIYPLQIETKQIELALEALTTQQRFIVECKYFEDMFWKEIELNYNRAFNQQNYISQDGLKKINRESLELLADILKPYYERFKTA